jgi:KDO2-lipid IV(A) lauroyltransferase
LGRILFYFLKTISYLPFWFWHGFADILWLLNYYVIGYRKKVVLTNLEIAFPEKTEDERKKIARKFFRNFSDFIIESIKGFSMSQKSFEKRYRIENKDEVKQYILNSKRGAVATAGHIFNWEWMIFLGASLPDDIKGLVSYTPISNKSLNRLVKANRERFGLTIVPSKKFVKTLEDTSNSHLTISGLIADQSPKANYKFRTEFFGVDVPFYTGPESSARKHNQSFWFLNMRQIKRSHYVMNFELIADHPSEYPENELTKIYIKKVEDQIRKYPDNYLWTHRRWKHRSKSE